MHITGKTLVVHINYTQQLFNMSQQAISLVNKRFIVVHNTMNYHIKSALKRHVWGVFATHLACLNILINSLKGDAQQGQYNQTNTYDSRRLY